MSEFSDISPRPRSPHLKEELCNCYGDIDNELNKCHDRMDRYKKKIHDRMDKHEKKLKRLSNEIASMLSILDRHIPLKITEFSDKSPGSRLLHLIEKLYNWIEEKDNVVKELNDLADNLDEHFNRISKANIVGPVASIVGFGNAGARGATVSEYVTTDAVLSKNRRKSVEIILKIYNYQVESLKKECVELGELLKQHGNIEESFPIWNCFWAKLVIGEAALAKNIGWDIISRTVSNSLRVASYADDTILEGARAGVKTFKTVGSTAGRGLHIADGGFGILLLPIDIYTLVYSSIDDPKTNPHKASEGIRKTAAKLTKECPSKEEIEVMIDKTLFILINDMQ